MLLSRKILWDRVVEATERALANGSLVPIATDQAHIDDGGIRFFVRVLAGLRRKDEARKKQEADSKAGKNVNPFLPPEPELTVGQVTDTHIAVLNKFNVVEHHLLIVTKHFEDQETLLTPADFEALWLCMSGYNSLGFYNGGREAGASQRHKHLQLVPLPLAHDGPEVPIQPLLPFTGTADQPESIPAFPFLHSFSRFRIESGTPVHDAAARLFSIYSRMLTHVNMEPPAASGLTRQSLPYCFLMMKEWMLLVPRSREFFDDISFNSLAFVGSLFVRDQEQLRRLRSFGPMNALKAVAVEKKP